MSQAIEQASRWMYRGLWAVGVELFRVPPESPTIPAHGRESVQTFHPAEGYLRYLKFWFWIVLLTIDIALTVGTVAAVIALCAEGLWWVAVLIIPPALFIIIAPDIVAYIAIHLKYDTMWYVMTDRSIRIRRGIWIIHEVTITFENVQNLKVQQGPVQRHFGIANLIIETAGAGSSAGGGKHGSTTISNQGVIEGVSNEVAAELRDRMLQKLRTTKSAGLGDEDREAVTTSRAGFSPAHIAVLREIRAELATTSA
jgi:membrane protein YdbS with pleckstrin-like domain